MRFDDLLRLATMLGFELDRHSGSHHILRHPDLAEGLNLQDFDRIAAVTHQPTEWVAPRGSF